jgi:hypothetical protein
MHGVVRRVVASSSLLSQLGGLNKRRREVLELVDEELGAGGDELDEAGGDELDEAGGDELDEESGDELDGDGDEDLGDDGEFVPASPEAEAEAAAHAEVEAAQDRAHTQGQAEEHDAHKRECDDDAPGAGRAPARAPWQATLAYVDAVSESDDESMPRAPRDVAAPQPLESLGQGRRLGPVPAPAALVAPMTVSSYSVSVAVGAGGVLAPAGMPLPLSRAQSVAAGEKRARPYSWSELETAKLKLAVSKHGRDWAAVAKEVGSKDKAQCRSKVTLLVKGGRISTVRKMTHKGVFCFSSSKEDAALDETAQLDQHEAQLLADEARGVALERVAGTKRRCSNWLPDEETRLNEALERDARANPKRRDWAAIAGHVATKTILQCETKVSTEVKAGRMAKPDKPAHGHDALMEHQLVPVLSLPPQPLLSPQPLLPAALFPPPPVHDSASAGKLLGLPDGTAAMGSADAGARARARARAVFVLAGSHGAPASNCKPRIKERRARWTEDEIARLEQAILRHGTKWADVTRELGGNRQARQCKKKVAFEVARGRMQKPTSCRSYSSPQRSSPQAGGENSNSGITDGDGDDDGEGGDDDDNDDGGAS